MDYLALGQRIRNRRKEMRLSLEKLSSMVGISAAFLGLIERGGRKASMETLVKLANAMQISMDSLLADSLSEAICPMGVTEEEWPRVLKILEMIRQ